MTAVAEISARCEPASGGWRCRVTVAEAGTETRHDVSVSTADLARFETSGTTDPTELVRAAFAFLLEREPKESILSSFALPVIERYFPEFGEEMRRRRGRVEGG